jgi:hypothetical protein
MLSERLTPYQEAREALLRPLPIHPNTLGRMAVEAANVEAIVALRPDVEDEDYIQGYRDYTETSLAEVRSELMDLCETQESVVEYAQK